MIRGLFVLTVIILCINVVWVFASPLIKNVMLEGKIHEVALNRGNKTEVALQKEIMTFAYDKGINLTEKNLMIRNVEGQTLIAVRYRVDARYWKYSRTYKFFPTSSEKAELYWKHERSKPGTKIG